MTQKCSCHGSGDKHSQTIAAVLERPRYSSGLILEDSDLTSAVDYTRSLSRLLFRNLFGCGVICGLVVSVDEECGLAVTVSPGLALDGCGDPIEVPRPITITLDRAEVEALQKLPKDKGGGQFWVVLCGGEKMCAPRSLVCESDEFDGVAQPTRIRALAGVSLAFERPECGCACGPHTEPVQQYENAAPLDDEVDCHRDHETRTACEPDCGCGTACACGCCLLLAHVHYGFRGEAAGQIVWTARNRGVRRFIRPKLLPDPVERPEDWDSDMETRVFYMGTSAAPPASNLAKEGLGLQRGQWLTQRRIKAMIESEEQGIRAAPADQGSGSDSSAEPAAASARKSAARGRPAAPEGQVEEKKEAEDKK